MRHWMVMMLGSTFLTRLRAVEAMARLSSNFVSTFMQVKSSASAPSSFTRPKPAYGRQGLDWIVGPGYSFAVFSTNKTMETNQKP